MHKKISDDEKKIKLSTLVYGILALLMIFIGVSCVLAYGTRTEIGSKIAAKIAMVLPFPAAVVELNHVIYLNDVTANMASVEKFYKSQDFAKEGMRIDFTTEDGKKRLRIKEREILNKMVEDKIIQFLAQKKGISVTDDAAEKMLSQKLEEFGTADEVKSDLLNSYGWSMDDFKKHVVLPSIYSDELSKIVISGELSDTSAEKSKINKAKNDLENGKDFAGVARTYSEGPSRGNGGELGWAKKDQVLPEIQDAFFGKDVPAKNMIIESSIGFHIVDVENSKKENGETVLQLRQIFVAKKTFADWLENQKKQIRVFVPLSDFTWDSKSGMVDFRDKKMREFETQERAKAKGDASITF